MKWPNTSGKGKDSRCGDLAEYMADAILSGQRSLAGSLNKKIARVGQGSKRRLLILLCVILGTINLLILIQSLT